MTAALGSVSSTGIQLTSVLTDSPSNDEYRFSVNLRKHRHAGARRAVRKTLRRLRSEGVIQKGWLDGDIARFDVRISSENARGAGEKVAEALGAAIVSAQTRAAARLQYRDQNAAHGAIPHQRSKKRQTALNTG
jgi:hypothetical protein